MSANIWPKAVPLLVLATLLAYANCVNKILVFDDDAWIVNVPALDEHDVHGYLSQIQGRPLLGLSNYAMHRLGRNNPVPHHVLNIFIHLAAGLTLYGIVRRSLLRPRFSGRFEGRAAYLAFAAALLFLLHPLQVQCVTYIIQRGESMAGLFYMLVLYCMFRAEDVAPDAKWAAARRFSWYALSIHCLVLGYLSKEIMASIPAAVILFDRIFLSTRWKDLIRKRWLFYLAFLLVWGAFTAWHLTRAEKTEGGIGFQQELTPKTYALTQTGVILYYLRLCFWPRGMVIDYQSWPWWRTAEEAMPELAIVGGMLAITGSLLLWRPTVGYLAAMFFVPLAPTSSVLPIVDAVFEHRMYLSVGPVAILVVLLGNWLLGTLRLGFLRPAILAAVAVALGTLTILRNEHYRSREALWERAVERMPDSVRARTNLAQGLLLEERSDEAIAVLNRAIELSPYDPTALSNLAYAYDLKGNFSVVMECYERIADAYSDDPKNWKTYADSLLLLGRWESAARAYRRGIELKADMVDLHYGLAAALYSLGRDAEAEQAARAATALDPNWPEAVLELARSTILDDRKRSFPEARRSALVWAGLGLQFSPKPTARQRDIMGLCYASQGEFLQAGAQSLLALEESPDDLWASVHRERLRQYEQHRTPWPTD